MPIETIADFYKALIHGPYAWPGGYPCYFIMSDGESVAFDVGFSEVGRMLEALTDYQNGFRHEHSGWRPIALDINWEDADLICAHTGERIESAYAE